MSVIKCSRRVSSVKRIHPPLSYVNYYNYGIIYLDFKTTYVYIITKKLQNDIENRNCVPIQSLRTPLL